MELLEDRPDTYGGNMLKNLEKNYHFNSYIVLILNTAMKYAG